MTDYEVIRGMLTKTRQEMYAGMDEIVLSNADIDFYFSPTGELEQVANRRVVPQW